MWETAGRQPGDASADGLPVLTVVATAVVVTAVAASLPFVDASAPRPAVAGGVAAGAAVTLLAYFAAPQRAWLPYLPAAATVGALMATTGGANSPFRTLLLVLVIGGATLPRRHDLLAAMGLVVGAAASPALYQPWPQAGHLADALTMVSAALAAVIVRRVAAQQRAATREIEQSTRLVSSVLSSLPQQAAVIDPSGRIVLTNQAWDRIHALSGQRPETFTAGVDYALCCRHRDGATVEGPTDLVEDLRRILTGEATTAVSSLSWELLVGEHHRFTVRTTALPEAFGAVVTHEDITPLVEAERVRQASLDRLDELDSDRTTLLQAVSQDVRTPLTIMTGAIATLQQRRHQLDEPQVQRLTDGLASQARRLERLLSALLLLTSASDDPAGSDDIRPEPTRLRAAITASLARIDPEGGRFRLQEPDDDLQVEVDRWILHDVLDRLLDNALRHSPPHATIAIASRLSADGRLTLEATADGAAEAADHDRLPNASEPALPGRPHDPAAQLSLTVLREAARVHGGDAWAELAGPHGTRFVVELDTNQRSGRGRGSQDLRR